MAKKKNVFQFVSTDGHSFVVAVSKDPPVSEWPRFKLTGMVIHGPEGWKGLQ